MKNNYGAKLFKEYTLRNSASRAKVNNGVNSGVPDFLSNVKSIKQNLEFKSYESSSDDCMTPAEHFKQILDMI